jgi:hypothetical protein
MFEIVEKIAAGFVVIESVIITSQMAVHSQSSESRGPALVGTCWVGLASSQCLQPSRDGWVQELNAVVQGSKGVR